MKHGQSRTETFWAARVARCRLASSSVSAGGRSSIGWRASAGTSAKRSSMRSIPIVRSMWARSSAVSWVKSGMLLEWSVVSRELVARLLGVLLGGEQCVDGRRVLGLNFDHPAGFVRIVVDALGLIGQLAVHLDHFAGHRRVQVGRRLDGFDHAELLARLEAIAYFR